jgi:predicted  nucleic acid-binding Zn-ribbon protein
VSEQGDLQISPEKLIAKLQKQLGEAMGAKAVMEVAVEQLQEAGLEKDQRIQMLLSKIEDQNRELGELRERLDSGDSSG